jgi:ribosomal protein S17
MEISYACRVDGFEIPRGETAPAVIEIARPISKTQSWQIKSDPLKPAAG